MYLAKYNSEGEFQWMFKVGESNWSQYPIFIDIVNNRIAVTMIYTGTVDIDPSSNTVSISGNNSEAFLEYSLNGDYISRKTYGGDCFLRDIEYREDGSYITCGSFGLSGFDINFNGTTIVSGNGFNNAFIASYNSSDQLLWHTTLDEIFLDNLVYEVELNSKDEIIVAGVFDGVDIGGEEADREYYIIKYDSNGNLMDSKKLSENLYVIDLQIDSEDRIWLESRFDDDYSIMDNGQEITFWPVEDNNNRSIMVFDDEFNYVDGDQISSNQFWASGLLFNSNDEAIVCNGVTSDGKLFYSTDEEVTIEGSDNITIQYLSFGACENSSSIIDQSICDGETFVIGNENFSISGTFNIELVNSEGCDSSIVLNLAVLDEDVSVDLAEDQLSTSIDADFYQWYDCDSNLAVEDAVENVFNPQSSGSYYVEVIVNQCSYESDCQDIILTSINDNLLKDTRIYPNPTHDDLIIENELYNFDSAFILSFDGKVV